MSPDLELELEKQIMMKQNKTPGLSVLCLVCFSRLCIFSGGGAVYLRIQEIIFSPFPQILMHDTVKKQSNK